MNEYKCACSRSVITKIIDKFVDPDHNNSNNNNDSNKSNNIIIMIVIIIIIIIKIIIWLSAISHHWYSVS